MMLASRRADPDSPFDVPLMAHQCLLQLWGAHYEITSLACSWIHQVAGEPVVLERLRRELDGTIAAAEASSSATVDTLRRLPYLDATIRETLRVLPPTSTAARRLTRSLLLDGVLYEKGWKVIAEPRLAHRLEETFPEPHRFRPERFLAGEGGAADLTYAFIPFGGGVHACIGAQMAVTIMKVLAIHLLRSTAWQRRGEASFREFPLRMIRPGYRIDLQPR
jgi:cytochrome P450